MVTTPGRCCRWPIPARATSSSPAFSPRSHRLHEQLLFSPLPSSPLLFEAPRSQWPRRRTLAREALQWVRGGGAAACPFTPFPPPHLAFPILPDRRRRPPLPPPRLAYVRHGRSNSSRDGLPARGAAEVPTDSQSSSATIFVASLPGTLLPRCLCRRARGPTVPFFLPPPATTQSLPPSLLPLRPSPCLPATQCDCPL